MVWLEEGLLGRERDKGLIQTGTSVILDLVAGVPLLVRWRQVRNQLNGTNITIR